METNKSAFLAQLESEFDVSPMPVSVSASSIRKPQRKVSFKAYWLGIAISLVGPLLVLTPSPAAAESCTTATGPSPVSKTHFKYCSLATYQYNYLSSTVYYSARTICYNFHAYAWMCSVTSQYDRGEMTVCKSY